MREWHGLYETRVVVLALQSSASALRTCNDVVSKALGGSFHIWVQILHQKFGGWGLDLDARWPLYTNTYHTHVWLFYCECNASVIISLFQIWTNPKSHHALGHRYRSSWRIFDCCYKLILSWFHYQTPWPPEQNSAISSVWTSIYVSLLPSDISRHQMIPESA